MKSTLAVFAVGAALAFAGGIASTPAAASSNNAANAAKGQELNVVSDTDMSSHRRRYRHRHVVRPWPVYRYSYGYYRPRPYYYRPYSYAYYPRPYAYYPSRHYYRPYYRPGPSFSIGFGFGPSFYW